MKFYDQIKIESIVRWGIPIVLTLLLLSFLLARPISNCKQEIGYAFCNPTLWLLGQDDLMWERPLDPKYESKNMLSDGGIFLCILSFFVHVAVLIFIIVMLVTLWVRAAKKRARRL